MSPYSAVGSVRVYWSRVTRLTVGQCTGLLTGVDFTRGLRNAGGYGVAEAVGSGLGDAGAVRSAMAFSNAAMVAASTTPVGSTPSSVWKAMRASVSSGVQMPSTG